MPDATDDVESCTCRGRFSWAPVFGNDVTVSEVQGASLGFRTCDAGPIGSNSAGSDRARTDVVLDRAAALSPILFPRNDAAS